MFILSVWFVIMLMLQFVHANITYIFQGLIVGLESGESMQHLMEIATGRVYDNEYTRFCHPLDKDMEHAGSTRIWQKDETKEEIVRNAMEKASKASSNNDVRAKRIALGRAAISRRVRGPDATRNRSLGFGQKRFKNTTASLVAAEKQSQQLDTYAAAIFPQ